MHINWIQTLGNFSTISNDGAIQFNAPQRDESELEKEARKIALKYSSVLKSSVFFETGEIGFTFTVLEPDATITIRIGDLVVGINSTYSKYLYSIRKAISAGAEFLSGAGTKGILVPKEEYKLNIKVDGSNVTLYINDVVVAKTISTIVKDQLELTFFSLNNIVVKKIHITTHRPKAFIVMQFTDEYNELYNDVIKPVTESFNYECIRADEFYQSSLILNDIIDSIKESSVIIADITPDNPNVNYEVGYAHALNKPTILLSDKKREKLPFDVSGFRTLFYDNTIGGKTKVEEKLKKHFEHLTQV